MARRSVLPVLLAVGFLTSGLRAQEPVTTPDVHLLARTIQEEIEIVRWQMGRPLETRSPIPVAEVAIRVNFRQAMTLWRKVNQLGVELVGGGETPPIVTLPRGAEYGPAQVQQVLSSVFDRLQEIRDGAGIVGRTELANAPPAPPLNPMADPSDVFQVIVQSNRQVNRMLERQSQPGDVFQQVQQGIYYMADILSASGEPNPYPAVPEYEPGLRPGDVYGRLLLVLERLSVGSEALGFIMVRWSGGVYEVDDSLTPSDVFDVATLLLSELEYLHSLVPGAQAPLLVPHPGLRFPSDVYQQVGILSDQATRFMSRASRTPELFRAERSDGPQSPR